MRSKTKKYIRMLGVSAIAALVLFSIFNVPWEGGIEQGKTSTEEVAKTMFEEYQIAFLFIAFILFSAMLGGMFLAKDEESRENPMKPDVWSKRKSEGGGQK